MIMRKFPFVHKRSQIEESEILEEYTIYVCSKVDFADIVDPEDRGVPSIGCVVSCAVVQRAAGGEG